MLKTKPNPQSQSERPVERKYRAQIKPFALRLKTAARATDMSEGKLRTAIEDKELAAVRSGKCILILTSELERYVASLPPAELKPRPAKLRQREQARAARAARADR